MDGMGAIVYPNNDTFEGTWEKGIRSSGKFVFSDANNNTVIYERSFMDGVPGNCIMFLDDLIRPVGNS
jgi:hypothetical protein